MKTKKSILILSAVVLLGLSSCAQELCSAYAEADNVEQKDKNKKKEAQF